MNMPEPVLHSALQSDFDRNGYVLLKQRLSIAQSAELSRWADELASWPESPGRYMKWYERAGSSRQLCRVEDFLPYHTQFARFLTSGDLAACLHTLIGEPAVLFKEKINFKLPGGAGFAPHQDAPAFTAFGQRYHVTVMIAIDASTRANGCLEIAQNERTGVLPRESDGTIDRGWSARQHWEPIEMSRGDVLIFDSLVAHRSGGNRSSQPRRALYVTYNRSSEGSRRAEYFEQKRMAFPPECERIAGVDYSAAAATYNLGNPIL